MWYVCMFANLEITFYDSGVCVPYPSFVHLLLANKVSRPVYEMVCRDVAVMRRRSDAYLNATQILKVAGFDKPQRTRVLEREVQKGEHEKVQGGYGKYQGQITFFPFNHPSRKLTRCRYLDSYRAWSCSCQAIWC